MTSKVLAPESFEAYKNGILKLPNRETGLVLPIFSFGTAPMSPKAMLPHSKVFVFIETDSVFCELLHPWPRMAT